MPAITVVDQIRDQADITGPLQDQGALTYDGPSGKFKTVPITYVHDQALASATWNIHHNLGRFPSVTVVDSSGTVVYGNVQYIDTNNLTISFSVAFGGTAYIN